MKYEWIIFDADNTLFDYDTAECLALKATMDSLGIKWHDGILPKYREINQSLFKQLEEGKINSNILRLRRFEELFNKFDITHDVTEFSIKYLTNLASGSMLLPSVKDVITKLYKNFKLLILTNGISDVQRPRISNSDIGHCFDELVISDEVGISKPDKGIFKYAFEKMGNPSRNKVLIVGDSLSSDIKGGSNFGIDTFLYNPSRISTKEKNHTYEIIIFYELVLIVNNA
jgi:putative hydrolase of the HAD superfamily